MISKRDKTQLKEATTELLDGIELGDTIFDFLLDNAQSVVENIRPWVILRSSDTSQTLSTSDTFETAKELPADFRRYYGKHPIVLLSGDDDEAYLSEVPMKAKNFYRSKQGKFYVDYKNNDLFITGGYSKSLTIQQNYISASDAVSDDNEWVFPGEYHLILPMLVSIFHREGIDYDVVGARNASGVEKQAQALVSSMEKWDDELQNSMTEGQDYVHGHRGTRFGEKSGHISDLI